MENRQFDSLARAVAGSCSRRMLLAGLLGGVALAIGADWHTPGAEAHRGVSGRGESSAGNGGVADADANGGTVSLGDINSGGNAGNAISVGDTVGGVSVSGGSVANGTDVAVDAPGGTAISDASGGNGNVAGSGGRDHHDDDRWYDRGEVCPWYCDWGYGCANCATGYCNRNGDCDDWN